MKREMKRNERYFMRLWYDMIYEIEWDGKRRKIYMKKITSKRKKKIKIIKSKSIKSTIKNLRESKFIFWTNPFLKISSIPFYKERDEMRDGRV